MKKEGKTEKSYYPLQKVLFRCRYQRLLRDSSHFENLKIAINRKTEVITFPIEHFEMNSLHLNKRSSFRFMMLYLKQDTLWLDDVYVHFKIVLVVLQ